MSPNDDYLWDRTGEPDPEVQRLERLLGRFRHEGPVPALPEPTERPARRAATRWLALAAALAVAAGLGLWLRAAPAGAGWEVARVAGAPSVAGGSIGKTGRLGVGQWLETDAQSQAQIRVPGLGFVDVAPGTRIGLKGTSATEHRLSLQRGEMHAVISAPPRLFLVETPSALAVDLGCAYSLTVDERGRGLLHVVLGSVALQSQGRESIIPSGTYCETRPGQGMGTPYAESAPAPLRAALARLDFEDGGDEALGTVLAAARETDVLSLRFLLGRLQGSQRERVDARLAELTQIKD